MMIRRSYRSIAIIAVLGLCALLLGVFYITPALAATEEKQKDAPQAEKNTPPAKEEASPSAKNKPAPDSNKEPSAKDPNEPNEKNDEDIFDLRVSTFVLINQAYDRIFTPELITEDGLVDYQTLRRLRGDLDVLTAKRELKKLNPGVLMALTPQERQAFWINTYNFCTIQLILDNYPIQPKWYMIIYPDNSIMQIIGAWTKVYFEILREEYTLKEIEQDFLLKRYQDPRICFALSNATIGGATLRNEPYKADRLDEQLDDQVAKYLATKKGMVLNKDTNILNLSNLFPTHAATFLASDLAAVKKFRKRKDEERIWLNFLAPHLSEEDVRYLEKDDFKIKFIEFNWHLNEKK